MNEIEDNERAQPAVQDADPPPPRNRRRAVAVIVLASLVVATIGGLVVINSGDVADPAVATAQNWERLDVDVPEGGAKRLDLHEGIRRAMVVIAAHETTCWNAFILDKSLQGCGRAIYEVLGAPRVVGMNVTSTETDQRFLGMAAWSDDGETLLQSSSSSNKLATVALNVILAE